MKPAAQIQTNQAKQGSDEIARHRGGPLILVIALVCLALYAPLVGHEFVGWDDLSTILGNDRLQAGGSGLLYYWLHSAEGLYIPLTYTVWWLLAQISLEPGLYHAASIAFHTLAAVVVFDLLRQMIGKDAPACLGALIFALHPVQVESVAWASGLKDVLCGLLMVLSLRSYWQYSAMQRGKGALITAIVFYVLAMIAKPTAMITPLLMAVLDLTLLKKPVKSLLGNVAPMLLLAVPIFVITRLAQTVPEGTYTPIWTRPLIAADSLAFYIVKILRPMPLTLVYGRGPQSVVDSGVIAFTWMVPATVGVGVWLLRRRVPLLLPGACIFAASLLPTLGLTRFMYQTHSTVADHYLYVAMFGVAMMSAGLISILRAKAVYPIAMAALAVLAILTSMQLRHWRSSLTLFMHAAGFAPNSVGVQGNLGRALATAGRIDEALPRFERAVELSPADREERIALAQALFVKGRHAESALHARIALDLALAQGGLNAETTREHYFLGKSLAMLNDLEAAQYHLSIAARRRPNDPAIAAERDAVRARIDAGGPASAPATLP